MESTTKEKILDAALVCYAESGYKGTNLRELAAGMGLSKSALYKHYTSKEAIWDAVLDRMERYYNSRFGSPETLPPVPKSCEEFFSRCPCECWTFQCTMKRSSSHGGCCSRSSSVMNGCGSLHLCTF